MLPLASKKSKNNACLNVWSVDVADGIVLVRSEHDAGVLIGKHVAQSIALQILLLLTRWNSRRHALHRNIRKFFVKAIVRQFLQQERQLQSRRCQSSLNQYCVGKPFFYFIKFLLSRKYYESDRDNSFKIFYRVQKTLTETTQHWVSFIIPVTPMRAAQTPSKWTDLTTTPYRPPHLIPANNRLSLCAWKHQSAAQMITPVHISYGHDDDDDYEQFDRRFMTHRRNSSNKPEQN